MNKLADDREWFVYTLNDPRTDEVRYVGWTFEVKRRLREHIKKSKRMITHKDNWIASIIREEVKPTMEIIESGFGDSWAECERKWIAHHRGIGTRLTNATDGGEGTPGYNHSQETKEKMRGRKLSPEAKDKVRQAQLGRKHTPERIEKTRQANLGRKNTQETKDKMSQAAMGRKRTPETREKIRQAKLGIKLSAETREKISQAGFGRKWNPDRKQTPGSIEAMRVAAKASRVTVRRVEDGMVFESISEAARYVGRNYSSVSSAIKLGRKSAGFHWEKVIEQG